jgi:hypothetical protein
MIIEKTYNIPDELTYLIEMFKKRLRFLNETKSSGKKVNEFSLNSPTSGSNYGSFASLAGVNTDSKINDSI